MKKILRLLGRMSTCNVCLIFSVMCVFCHIIIRSEIGWFQSNHVERILNIRQCENDTSKVIILPRLVFSKFYLHNECSQTWTKSTNRFMILNIFRIVRIFQSKCAFSLMFVNISIQNDIQPPEMYLITFAIYLNKCKKFFFWSADIKIFYWRLFNVCFRMSMIISHFKSTI